jgi:hypothetical protein
MMKAATLLATGILLAGCKVDITPTIFTSDVLAVVETGTPLDTSAVLGFDAGTDERCKERGPAITSALLKGFSQAEFIGCREGALTTIAEFRVAVPMVRPGTTHQSALAITAQTFEDDDRIYVALNANGQRIDQVIAALPSEVRSSLTGTLEPHITARVQNDQTEATQVSIAGAFVDGAPYQLDHETTLQRRDETVITLSDVGNAALYDGASLLFWMKMP